jgi:hypothetical protein
MTTSLLSDAFARHIRATGRLIDECAAPSLPSSGAYVRERGEEVVR